MLTPREKLLVRIEMCLAKQEEAYVALKAIYDEIYQGKFPGLKE